uniref:NADH:ubiquinone reductase (H(+)-translocating) n=1 Tax=Postharmostomum commutatum TaxID=2336775 RepID=A0A5C1D7T9_9TREM|nr:NADH dehydrogenase subunit 5 [Postharmostomum commutatum]QEL51330.1 NADH dehydrogenase subunit 5 [Postharmostomum commutatum]
MFVLLSVVFSAIGFVYLSSCMSGSFEAGLYSFVYNSLSFVWVVDQVSLISACMLIICSSFALIYCSHYFWHDENGLSLFKLVVMFVGVMMFLIFSNSLVLSLIFWEYLGFVSFLLILFYSNMSSLRAALITLASSRFGDVALFVVLAVILRYDVDVVYFGWVLLVGILLVLLTKSASFPFVAWLLEAMRAPTPVSSLVHSSTLVAAGVWFCLRYVDLVNGVCIVWLFIFSIVSILISGWCAYKYEDLKKIVALSTCNNIAWCLVFFVCGSVDLALYQLISHGVSKCFLFMLVGDVMSGSGGSQSAAGVYLTRYYGRCGTFLLGFLILSLCGLPFIGIFFSKHYMFGSLCGVTWNVVCGCFVFLGFLLSYVYSFRFVFLLCDSVRGLSLGWSSNFFLIAGLVVLGSVINLVCVGSMEEANLLGVYGSVGFLLIQVLGAYWGWLGYSKSVASIWDYWLWGNSLVVAWCYWLFWKVQSVFKLGIYRWEILLVKLVSSLLFLRLSIYSVSAVVAGLVFILFFVVF